MRRTLLIVLAALVAVLALGTAVVATGGGGSSITKPRLERSLPATFSHLYVQQATLLGRPGITAKSLHAQAMCDKAGAQRPDVGPGSDWVCLMSWHDPQNPMPTEGYGKFELNVHSNDCYTAGGPSSSPASLGLTDKAGKEVTEPGVRVRQLLRPARGPACPSRTPLPLGGRLPSAPAWQPQLTEEGRPSSSDCDTARWGYVRPRLSTVTRRSREAGVDPDSPPRRENHQETKNPPIARRRSPAAPGRSTSQSRRPGQAASPTWPARRPPAPGRLGASLGRPCPACSRVVEPRPRWSHPAHRGAGTRRPGPRRPRRPRGKVLLAVDPAPEVVGGGGRLGRRPAARAPPAVPPSPCTARGHHAQGPPR